MDIITRSQPHDIQAIIYESRADKEMPRYNGFMSAQDLGVE